MAISVVGKNTDLTAGTSSISVPFPTGTTDGDLVILCVHSKTATPVLAASDYIESVSTPIPAYTYNTNITKLFFCRITGTPPTAARMTVTGGTNLIVGWSITFRGVASTPVNAYTGQAAIYVSLSSGMKNFGPITSTVAGTYMLDIVALSLDTAFTNQVTTYTNTSLTSPAVHVAAAIQTGTGTAIVAFGGFKAAAGTMNAAVGTCTPAWQYNTYGSRVIIALAPDTAKQLVGTVSGTAAVEATLTVDSSAVAISGGVASNSTLEADVSVQEAKQLVATVNGTAALEAALLKNKYVAVFCSVNAASSILASLNRLSRLLGSIDSASSITGEIAVASSEDLMGYITAASSTSGILEVNKAIELVAIQNVNSTLDATLTRIRHVLLEGAASGTTAIEAALLLMTPTAIAGNLLSTSSVEAFISLKEAVRISGTLSGSSAVEAALLIPKVFELLGDITEAIDVSAILSVDGKVELIASIDSKSTVDAWLRIPVRKFYGTAACTVDEYPIELKQESYDIILNIIEYKIKMEVEGMANVGASVKLTAEFPVTAGDLSLLTDVVVEITDENHAIVDTITAVVKDANGIYHAWYVIPDGYTKLYYAWSGILSTDIVLLTRELLRFTWTS